MTININNKIKQAHAGNWGKPNSTEQKVNTPEDIYITPPVIRGKKKHKKVKKTWSIYCCPFCNKELPKKPEDPTKKDWVLSWINNRETNCECGCYEVPICPSCKRTTWFNPTTKEYKHRISYGCGFIGRARE